MGLGDWFKSARPVSQLVKMLIQAAALYLSGKADEIPFDRGQGMQFNLLGGLRDRVIREVVKAQVKDARKGRYGEGVQSMLKFLDGKKTWIGIVLAHMPLIVDEVAKGLAEGGLSPSHFVKIAGYALMVLGVAHKLMKGE